MSFPLPPRLKRRTADFEIGKEVLGEGSLAIVRLAVEKVSGQRFALKAFDRAYLRSSKKEADVTIEEHCLRRANHPGIVKLHASFRDEEWHYFTLEHCPGGELWSMVRNVGCVDRLARHYLAQVFDAVQYLRDAQIVHRDLKAENVMIGQKGNCKLLDFGSAKDLANPQVKGAGTRNFKSVMEDYVGTSHFMAPEVVKNRSSDFRSDTWSLGCMVFQVLAGMPPFYGGSLVRVYKKISAGRLDVPEGWLTGDARDLIARMVVKDPDARLGSHHLQDVEAHPYFSGVRFEGVHGRAAPVLSLEEMCIRQIGQRWSQLGDRALLLASSETSRIRAEACATLRRIGEVSELMAGKANEGETSLSSAASQEGARTL